MARSRFWANRRHRQQISSPMNKISPSPYIPKQPEDTRSELLWNNQSFQTQPCRKPCYLSLKTHLQVVWVYTFVCAPDSVKMPAQLQPALETSIHHVF
jgi:hypothetical protein